MLQTKSKQGKRSAKRVTAEQYMTDGHSYEEAVELALQAALARRRELVEEGVIVAAIGARRGGLIPQDRTPAEIELARRLLAEAARGAFEREAGFGGTVVEETRARAPEDWRPARKAKVKERIPEQELIEVEINEKCIRWRAVTGRFLIQVVVRGTAIARSVRPATQTPGDIEAARLRAIRVRDAMLLVRQRVGDNPQLDLKALIAEAAAVP